MFLMLIVKPFSIPKSSSEDLDAINLQAHQGSGKPALIAKWLKDENGKLYCQWISQ